MQVQLRNGVEAVIRLGEDRDASQLLANGLHLFEQGDGQVLVPGELDLTHEQEVSWVRSLRDKPTNILLVADLDGKLAGHLDFYGATRKRLQHTGHFGIGVRLEFRGLGIGRALLKRLIDWARLNSKILGQAVGRAESNSLTIPLPNASAGHILLL